MLNRESSTRKTVFLSLLIAMGGALHLVESIIAIPLPIPGVKLGLANIVTLLAIRIYGFRAGVTVAMLRVTLGSLIGGLFLSPTYLLALSGSLLSATIMSFFNAKTSCFSNIGISAIGAISHNMGQLLAASILLQTTATIYYAPPLLLTAIPTGIATGYLLNRLLESPEAKESLKTICQRKE